MKTYLFTYFEATLISIIFMLGCFGASAQENIELTGRNFFAMEVANVDSSSSWYQDIFNLKLLKEIKPNNQIHIRIIGNDHLMIEMVENSSSKSIRDLVPQDTKSVHVQGIFKVGFYVQDIHQAEKYFKEKNVNIKHGIFSDDETKSTSFIIEDLNGTMIQVFQFL